LKRFIRYLYEYEQGKRIRNVGFVNVEQGAQESTLHIHGKGLRLSGGDALKVYLFWKEHGEFAGAHQGDIAFMGPSVNYRLRYTNEDTGGEENYDSVGGMLLKDKNGRTFAAVWEDQPVDIERIRLDTAHNLPGQEEKNTGEEEQDEKETDSGEGYAEKNPGREAGQTEEERRRREPDKEAGQMEREQQRREPGIEPGWMEVEQQRREPGIEPGWMEREQQRREPDREAGLMKEERRRREPVREAGQMKEERRRREPVREAGRMEEERRRREPVREARQMEEEWRRREPVREARQMEEEWRRREPVKEEIRSEREAGAEEEVWEKDPVREAGLDRKEQRMKEPDREKKQAEKETTGGKEQMETETPAGEAGRTKREPDGKRAEDEAMSKGADITQSQMSMQREACGETSPLQMTKIQRGDIARLPRCEWRLANNNFLLHGYHNYGYLVLLDDGKILRLGVPGIYHPKEARAAYGFGFPEFIGADEMKMDSEEEDMTEEAFGYWCRQVRRMVR